MTVEIDLLHTPQYKLEAVRLVRGGQAVPVTFKDQQLLCVSIGTSRAEHIARSSPFQPLSGRAGEWTLTPATLPASKNMTRACA